MNRDRVITELSEEAGFRVYSWINDTGVASLCRSKLWTVTVQREKATVDIFYITINIYTQARREAAAISPWGEALGLAKGFEVLDMAAQHTLTHSELSLLPRGDPKWGFE